tara:strand:+ start:950 stop:1474 length:525 start_codon:yes stop_codon:yes gene_type:complete
MACRGNDIELGLNAIMHQTYPIRRIHPHNPYRWLMTEPTLFTKIIRGEIPSSVVAQGDTWYAFLDINPQRPGHTLVVPKEQSQRIADLSPQSRRDLMDGVVEVQRRLSMEFETTDFSINVNDGPLAGQEVPHVHFHVIPRTDAGKDHPLWSMPGKSVEPDFEFLAELSRKLQLY